MGPFLIQRRLQFAKLNAFELVVESISAVAHVILAYLSPTVWALVLGGLVASAARTIGSYFLLSDVRHKFYISKEYAWQIFTFGKWIFISSIFYFLSMNFDRLYLGKSAPLELLGIYGIARTLSDLLSALIFRLASFVVFPLIASSSDTPRDELHGQLASIRLVLLLVAALGLSLFAAVADLLIEILYDQRYHAAGWMLPLLIIGAWFSILCSLNESTLLGFGKPLYGTVANSLKFIYLLIGLPLGYTAYGILGAVAVVAVGDLCRYAPIFVGQVRERFSYGMQDLFATLILLGLVGIWEWLRSALGFGTSFDALPIAGLT